MRACVAPSVRVCSFFVIDVSIFRWTYFFFLTWECCWEEKPTWSSRANSFPPWIMKTSIWAPVIACSAGPPKRKNESIFNASIIGIRQLWFGSASSTQLTLVVSPLSITSRYVLDHVFLIEAPQLSSDPAPKGWSHRMVCINSNDCKIRIEEMSFAMCVLTIARFFCTFYDGFL